MLERKSFGLLTDLYEMTMAYGYWKKGMADRESVFHLFFRKRPFKGEYAIAAGLQTLIETLKEFRFSEEDLAYLQSLKNEKGSSLFEEGFISYLRTFSFTCDIDAVPEGTVIFPQEPLLRIRGPILQAQLVESIVLNIINFQTLIATKASRVCLAASPDPVVEFGLRRAQGIDGAISATRAAFIGGCESTSNVFAGKLYDIPVRGTHAHSWIMAFDSEKEAFDAYAELMPDNTIFLVDTYSSLTGTAHAIEIAKKMKKKGKDIGGVRLDSGDLAQLSIQVRRMLDDEGFFHAKIMASNELDEYLIRDLKQQGAKISIWGVGTNLVTGQDQPALDGVYKLSAIADKAGNWVYKIKISDQLVKVTNPGILQVRRFSNQSGWLADMIYDPHIDPSGAVFIDPLDPIQEKKVGSNWKQEDLLVPILQRGNLIYQFPTLSQIQSRTKSQLEKLPIATRRFLNPQPYFVGLEKGLYHIKMKLIKEIKRKISE